MNAPGLGGAAAPLRVGLIGSGRIGRMHAGLLAGGINGAVLSAVTDAMPDLADEIGRTYNVPAVETDRLIADPAIDAVAICAPTSTHVRYIIEAAEAGKSIFCEKPVSLDLAEVDRALAVVSRAGARLMVGFNRRFDPSHAAVRVAVANGSVGAPHLVRITSRDPEPPPMSYARGSGGIFLDMTVHDFDMARYVVGSEVVEVTAAGAVRTDPELEGIGDVDTAVTMLRHENACLTVIDNSRQASYGYDQRVEVLGAKGLAGSDNPRTTTAFTWDGSGTRAATLPYFFIERYRESYLRQWEAFVASVASGTPPPTSGADGRAALVLGLAAKRSLLEHRTVQTAEIQPQVGTGRLEA
ncbi:MAG TPA: inositol 2-dehydrogenase [Acidimicrobiales bacterium]|nr:inositol 2-dehydrogenase [Acidimicrobiales bacterium]